MLKLKEVNFKCEKCNQSKATYVHHIDKTKTNHELSNLMAVCPGCHAILHKRTKIRNIKQYCKNYYKKNRIKILNYAKKYSKQYYKNNKDKVRKYQLLNADKIKIYQKQYHNKIMLKNT